MYEETLIHSEKVLVSDKLSYNESFDVRAPTGFAKREGYSVVVEAKREDGKSVCSKRESLTSSKGEDACI